MMMSENEKRILLNNINKNHFVLEYGSGFSTLEIAKLCKHITSIEHNLEWYNIVKSQKSNNCDLIFAKPNLNYIEGLHDGTYEEFKTYVDSPLNKNIFDIVLIDGRARVACASVMKKLVHKDSLIFIHDFERVEYQECLKYLNLIDRCERMAITKIKND